MKYIFVINEIAGDGKFQKELPSLLADAGGESGAIEIYHTTAIGDAERFAASFSAENGPYTVFACGGDGTLREVVNGVLKRTDGADVTVGSVPCGTGNDFVRAFTEPEAFLDITRQLHGRAETIDVLKVDDGYCVNIANLGFDANVADGMVRYKKRFGKMAYKMALAKELLSLPKYTFRMEFDDGEVREGDFLLVSAANGMAYGGGYYAAPFSSMRDGIIDFCFCDRVSRRRFLSTVGDYKAGKHFDTDKYSAYLHRKTAKSVTITAASPLALCQDGEIFHVTQTTIGVAPSALRFSVPAGCGFKNP